ncbi:probable auxin efflux carrier component 8 [Typha angustifolia]|uniref:probable auxin efflux carrier component 8 n=1 Tax=Typha angustifolia TaxID=59011 RepID=UPI003C2C3E21
MFSATNVYHVFEATVPLYVTMILAYLSIKWWNLFTPEQCSGINKFVAKFSIPLLSFQVISTNNPYQMNVKLLFSDMVQKLLAVLVFAVVSKACYRNAFDWTITGFSLSTLPNTLIVGIPLLKGMYGDEAFKLLSQIVVLQSLLWYNLLLCLFEFRAAKGIAATTQTENTGESDISVPIQAGQQEEEIKSLSMRCSSILFFLLMIGKKLVANPNTYASLAGLTWALISFRWELKLPLVIHNSITILSDGGLGMAMFSLGLFTASQSNIIACGARMMVFAMALRFIIGPALMAISSYACGMRGILLKVAIVQAALPQGIVTFVFAKEYGVQPDILSTGVILGMIVAVPVALAYYFLLDPN